MTQLGKLLVVAITILAMVFLALSGVVFMTVDNWKEKALAEADKVQKAQSNLQKAQEALNEEADKLAKLLLQHKTDIEIKDREKTDLQAQFNSKEIELTQIRKELSVAQQAVTLSANESSTRVSESTELRESLKSAQKNANDLTLQEADRKKNEAELTKSLEKARTINAQLREEVAILSSSLSKAGLNADARNVKFLSNPPEVEGMVSRVDSSSDHIELSIGGDDGLVPGHELFVFRRTPRAQYVGKIRIIATDPERSVATVVGKTYLGTRVLEGDIVSTTIKPRS
jgi:hypothetical protein